jgi:two-component system osmolarity sensor histidine kinase EnvZ
VTAHASLFRHAVLSIGTGLLAFLLISGVAVFVFVLRPFAELSADDFAALLVHSSRTWVELPPETRPALAQELADNHGLDLQEGDGRTGNDIGHHHPYIKSLRAALSRWIGPGGEVEVTETEDDRFHAYIPMAGRLLRFSFSADRINPYPVATLALAILSAAGVALFVASTLARRVAAPVTAFAEAARQIGRGERPPALPETEVRELAVLARVFNETAANLEAQRQNQATLLAGISHDLRSPLGRLRMAAGMLAEEQPSPLVARMEADITTMEALIAAQLQLARAREREAAQTVDVDALLRDVVGAAGTDTPELVRLRTDGPSCTARAAPIALRRVLANLLDNALLHAGSHELEVVRRRCRDAVYIGVRDRGPGIPPEFRDAIFRPYFRVEHSRNRMTGGSGLGLAIARQLADTHHWRLAVRGRVGGGSSFWIAVQGDSAAPRPDEGAAAREIGTQDGMPA